MVFHHGGEFVREKIMFYMCGVKSTVHEQNIEKWDLSEDHHVIDVATYVVGNSIEGHLNESSDEDANESDDDARNVSFDDSEEDKTSGLNDEFKVVEVDRPKEGSNKVDINEKALHD
ncbi:hypothetical protein KIW84_064063 [Lathyrus oleraceus]|uniref:Uncharacterized protein n=1 Tax=Pisum sativum TaxID=3888 RepID=A0A9D5A864_PEA|nr:hypothetical protein KIW84_064063 [Pisum sativum]